MKTKALAVEARTKDFRLEVKAVDETGMFEGYASVFGMRDSFNEMTMPGAFTGSLRRDWPAMLWSHRADAPIGIWKDLSEDKKGLWCKGEFNLETQLGKETHALTKQGAVKGLSIGYQEIEVEEPKDRSDPRKLVEVRLMEVSIVTFPALRQARIDSVKQEALNCLALRLKAGERPLPKEFEEVLREAGFPKELAKQIASVGYAKAIRSESEGTRANEAAIAELRAIVSGLLLKAS